MKIRFSANRWLVVLCLLMAGLIGIMAPVAARSLLGGGGAVGGGPEYVSISAIAFKPIDATTKYAWLGTMISNPETTEQCYFAPLNIPNNVKINKLVVYFNNTDTNPAANVKAYIETHNFFSYMMTTVATLTTTLHVTNVDDLRYEETSAITNGTVNLATNAYFAAVCMPPSAKVLFNGMRIDYGYPTSLPLLSKGN